MNYELNQRTRIDIRWRRRMLRSLSMVAVMIVMLEFLWYVVMGSLLESIDMGFFQYVLRYPVLTLILNFVALYVVASINSNKTYNDIIKNRAICAGLLVICVVIQIQHCDIKVFLIMPVMAVVVSMVLMDKPLVLIEIGITLFTLIVSIIRGYNMDIYTSFEDAVQSFIASIFIMGVVMVIAINIAKYEKAQMDTLDEIRKRQSNLMEEMKIDPLTGLFNRKTFDETVSVRIKNANNADTHGSNAYFPIMAVFDIDLFKRVNDNFGHIYGDEVLMMLSSIMRARASGIASAFRYGGEEFVMIFDRKTISDVVGIVEEIRTAFSAVNYRFAPGLKITVSAGIAQLEGGMDGKSWFSLADSALYTAKYTGRDKVVVLRENRQHEK